MSYALKYITPSGTEAWATNSSSNPSSLAEAIANATGGTQVKIAEGTYTLGAALTFPNGTSGSPIDWVGCTSAWASLDTVGRSAATGELIVTNFPLIDGGSSYGITMGTNNNFRCFNFTNAVNNATVSGVASATLYRCRISNTHTTGNSVRAVSMGANNYSAITDCDGVISSNNGNARGILAGRGGVYGCRVWNAVGKYNGQAGISLEVMASGVGNIVYGMGSGIICSQYAHAIHKNTIYNCYGSGIVLSTIAPLVSENIIYSVGSYGIECGGSGAPLLLRNAIGAATSGRVQTTAGFIEEIEAIVLTADPFTDSTNKDFTLNSTSGGGLLCRAASGYFGGQSDIGAVQHSDSGGGGVSGFPIGRLAV